MPQNEAPSPVMNPTLSGAGVEPLLEPQFAAKPAPSAGQRVAIIVNHGMGQQVPFETLELLAESVWRAVKVPLTEDTEDPPFVTGAQRPIAPPTVRAVRLGVKGNNEVETELERVEMSFATQDGRKHEVHFYEAYWAPLTEGKVSIGDVIAFFFRGGWDGLRNCGPFAFKRWMFGGMEMVGFRHLPTLLILLFLMVLIGSLVVVNAVIVAAAASHAIGAARVFPSAYLLVPFTSDLLAGDIAALLIFLATFVVPRIFKIFTGETVPPRVVAWLEWLLVAASALVLASLGYIMAAQLDRYAPERHIPGWPVSLAVSVTRGSLLTFLIWALAVAAAWAARWMMVEYVGDVTAYIAAHTVSKFWDLRHAIWETAMKVARAVYRARTQEEGGEFYYPRVIMVGHSLGSVIAYDVLNGMLMEEGFSKEPLHIADRTRMFVTFGSPLDKTAFVFRTQADANSEIREVAAAAVQPMIADYANRPQQWVNIYSRSDIISGALSFYDDPGGKTSRNKRVKNLKDPEARTPLVAHIEYWRGKLLAATLYRAIVT